MKKNFFMVTVMLVSIATMTTLVSCDNGKFETTEVVYEGLDTTGLDAPFVITSPDPERILVKDGDNLWDLSMAKWDEPTWRRFFENNPFLSEPGRVRNENGRIIVLIYPGEVLDFEGINDIPIITRLKETKVTEFASDDDNVWPWWVWVLIGAFVASLLTWATIDDLRVARLAREAKKRNADPVTQGPPVYKNGLNDTNVRSHYENRLSQEGTNLVVRNIRKGKLYSEGAIPTEYKDHDRTAIYNGQVGYEAEVVLPNGTVELRYTLQGCGNDLRRGANIPNVRFVPDAEQPVILQQPAVTETQPEQKIQEKIEEKNENKASAGEVLQTVILELANVSAEEIEITVGSVTFKAKNLNRSIKSSESVIEEKKDGANSH